MYIKQIFFSLFLSVMFLSYISLPKKGEAQSLRQQGSSLSQLTIYSQTRAQLTALAPSVTGIIYYCSNCSPAKIVVSTGTAAGQFATSDGGEF